MHVFSPKVLIVSLTIATVLAFAIATSGSVRAAQNRPTWTTGDYWRYANSDGDSILVEVHERSSLTLPGGTFSVWHVTERTAFAGGGSMIVHAWFQESNLGLAKGNLTIGVTLEYTFDPPLPRAVFPLAAGNSWSGQVDGTLVGTTFTLSIAYSGQVLSEGSVTVPAGTFQAAVIRDPSSANAHEERYYSEAVGNEVRRDTFNGQGVLMDSRVLTGYRYQAGFIGGLLLVVGIVVILGVAAVAALAILRKRRRPPFLQDVPPPAVPPPGT